jgi:hypothetical protein
MHTVGVISTHIDVGVVVVNDIDGAVGAVGAVDANR